MQHLHSLDDLSLSGAWVTIGSFDGVHRGHQAILSRLSAGALAAGQPSVAITFFPHPAAVLRGLPGPFYLTSPDERARLIIDLGVDYVVTLPFTPELAAQTAQEFMENLAGRLRISRLVVGPNFALGRGRQGDIPALSRLGETLGYTVEIVPPSMNTDRLISSTRIRDLISQGQMSETAALLGRWYSLSGKIVHGDGRGRHIGIPTANLAAWPERVMPARGVYATLAWIHNRAFPSVTNIGLRPTFENNASQVRIETHLLDFSEDLYEMELCLDFVKFLRPEQRFDSANALIDQIRQDILAAREVLPYVP